MTAPSKHLRFGLTIAALAALGTLSACTTTPTAGTADKPGKAPSIVIIPVPVPTPSPTIPDAHTTRDSVDWPGYYTGTIPCASCEGIQVWLNLTEAGKNTRYSLVENYLGKKGRAFNSSGNAVWRANGSVIDLKGKDENRALFIGENFAEFLPQGQNRATGQSNYILHKQDNFTAQNWQLLVDPRHIRVERKNGVNFVRFPALLNSKKVEQGGHRSLTANYVINCAKKQYDMPTVKYYAQPFATGALIYQSNRNGGNWLPTKNDGVLRQAAEQYCR